MASFDLRQISCSQKATQMEEKWGGGREFGLVNFSMIEIVVMINNFFWVNMVNLYYSDAPLKVNCTMDVCS